MIDRKAILKEIGFDTVVALVMSLPMQFLFTGILFHLGLQQMTNNATFNAFIFGTASALLFTGWSFIRRYNTSIYLRKKALKKEAEQSISTLAKNPAGPSGDRIDLWWNKRI